MTLVPPTDDPPRATVTWSSRREAVAVVAHRGHLRQTALIVGTVLFLINHLAGRRRPRRQHRRSPGIAGPVDGATTIRTDAGSRVLTVSPQLVPAPGGYREVERGHRVVRGQLDHLLVRASAVRQQERDHHLSFALVTHRSNICSQ